jgi:hypothetical protein
MTDRTHDALMDLLTETDPVDRRTSTGWAASPQADAILRTIVASGPSTAEPARTTRSHVRLLLLAAAFVLAAAAGAVAGEVLGTPAPHDVRRDIANVDQGMPADLRSNPDVQNARLAAVSQDGSLYVATLADGGYCFEIVTDPDGGRGAVCTQGSALGGVPIEITVPFTDPITARSPIVVGGRVNVAASSLEARFADGVIEPVALGADLFYLFDVPAAELASGHADGFELIARDATGAVAASSRVPASDTRSPQDTDRLMPIFVSTISTHDDFTKVLGVEGRVNVGGATRLELSYPDGTTVRIPVDGDGRYHYLLPEGRQSDLAERPGTLTAYDMNGDPVATAAYWHSLG